jgi:hypothetical protein
MTYRPFRNMSGPHYKAQVQQFRETGQWKHLHDWTPIPREKMALSLTFMLCLAIGIAVAILGGFHLYLVLTGQTTIEFHGNWVNRRRAANSKGSKKIIWKNPYDLGWKRNWQQVFGAQNPVWKAIVMPSRREPEFLPLPLPGEAGRRRTSVSHTTTGSRKGDELSSLLEGGGENIV